MGKRRAYPMPDFGDYNFDGKTYDVARDGVRLKGQLCRVFDAMRSGEWFTLSRLADRVGGSEAGVSARIRDLRKEKFGGHVIERRNAGGGLWEYRLVEPRPKGQGLLF